MLASYLLIDVVQTLFLFLFFNLDNKRTVNKDKNGREKKLLVSTFSAIFLKM